MTEVLYDPINNEIYLFDGNFEVDENSKKITICLITDGALKNDAKLTSVKVDQLFHIGWL